MPESCMYEAVKNNDIEAVRAYYQEHRGLLDDTDDGGYTILMEAAKKGCLEIVQCLVELGADINAYCEIIDHYSDQRGTPLTFALEEDNRDVAIYLIQKGADTETAYYYREDEQTPYSEPSVHSTCFMYAMDRSDMEMLELMLQKGFDINGFNAYLPDNTTPLFYAIDEAKPATVMWLLQHGADPLQCVEMYETVKVNALMFAVHLGLAKKYKADERFEIVEQLLKAGVNLSATVKGCDYETISDLVIECGDDRYIRLFGLQNIQERLAVAEEEPEEETLIPDIFEIEIGGEVSPTFKVFMDGDMLVWQLLDPEDVLRDTKLLPMKDRDWERFWMLCDMAGIWYWRKSFKGPDIYGGKRWFVHIGYRGKEAYASGDNAFPVDEDYPECEGYTPLFRKFLRAVNDLLHGLPFE